MNGKKTRHLRKVAKLLATEEHGTNNINVQVKQMTTNNFVMNEEGAMVREIVPNVTYTQVLNDDCPRKVYKNMKKGYEHV